MCLSVAVNRPADVLAKGVHEGFEWNVVHNGMGYRCGYVKVPQGHPWHGKPYDDIEARVHGGLTFAEPDISCEKCPSDGGFWIGFDCAHAGDARDWDLPMKAKEVLLAIEGKYPRCMEDQICTQAYVESECHSLCEQAQLAAQEVPKLC